MGGVSVQALASDEMLALMSAEENKNIEPEEMVALMVSKMTELYDDETEDNIIDKLCHYRQQPNESVRDFRARMKRVQVSL